MADVLLKIDGLSSGYEPLRGYDGWFRLNSFSPDLPRGNRGYGRGIDRSGEASTSIGFFLTREQDAATARLVRWATDGTTVREVTAEFIRDGGWYLRYRFSNAMVASVSLSGSEPGRPTESSGWLAEAFSVETPG